MTQRSRSRLRRLVRSLRLPFVGRGAVLLYHRVALLERDPWSMAVTPERFEAHLALLRQQAVCLPLRELLARQRAGTLPRNAVALTFDDGYADNLHAALPLLERHGIPATLLVATGFVGGKEEMWWDRLEQAVLGKTSLPERLALTIGKRRIEWSAPPDGDADARRLQLHDRLYDALAWTDTPVREAALDSLWWQLDHQPRLRPSHRPLLLEELERLAASELIEIGAHTRSHPHLERIVAARQQEELVGSKRDLEQWLDRPIDIVAYPHGSYATTTLGLARAAGFAVALTTRPRLIPHRADPLQIPRIDTEDGDGNGNGDPGEGLAALLRWYDLTRPRP